MTGVEDLPEGTRKRIKTFKRSRKDQNQGTTAGDLIQAVASGLFQPTREQRVVKSRFQTTFRKLSRDDRERLPMKDYRPEDVERLLGMNGLVQKWAESDDRFLPWLLNQRDFYERLEALAETSLEVAEEILSDTNPMTMGAKVALLKMLIPYRAQMEEQQKPKLDIATLLQGMDVNQLKLLVSSQAGNVGIAYEAPKQLTEGSDEQ